MKRIISEPQDKSSRLVAKFRAANRLQHILLNPNRSPHEERIAQKILRAMRAQGRIPRRRPIVQGIRSVIRRTVRRVRARRTSPATAARAADSGGSGDPEPEPPRPRSLSYSLPMSGGAL
jgi:hypothetical protein